MSLVREICGYLTLPGIEIYRKKFQHQAHRQPLKDPVISTRHFHFNPAKKPRACRHLRKVPAPRARPTPHSQGRREPHGRRRHEFPLRNAAHRAIPANILAAASQVRWKENLGDNTRTFPAKFSLIPRLHRRCRHPSPTPFRHTAASQASVDALRHRLASLIAHPS